MSLYKPKWWKITSWFHTGKRTHAILMLCYFKKSIWWVPSFFL